MNDLEKYFRNNNKRLLRKWKHYFDVYERHFAKYRNKEVVILEIGVFQGGSLQMWKNYFGPKAKIYGIDIEPKCKTLEEENIQIFIGSQSDREFLRKVKAQIPDVDILIDDGGHTMKQQIVSFEELFDKVKEDGVYLCEDLHTSYWPGYGGGHKRNGSFIEYSKNFIDYINAWHSQQSSLKVNAFTKSANSLHYYDSMLVIEKYKREAPVEEATGVQSFEETPFPESSGMKILKKVLRPPLKVINAILAFFKLGGIYRN
ncbi:MAG: class I SAM-dependent methyltransferase [Sphingobacteriaceae bacterium]|nr:class I SAM-dependent methyltransferase [Sphingobacteriaceae bacterium]